MRYPDGGRFEPDRVDADAAVGRLLGLGHAFRGLGARRPAELGEQLVELVGAGGVRARNRG